jgi:hypothetical protein
MLQLPVATDVGKALNPSIPLFRVESPIQGDNNKIVWSDSESKHKFKLQPSSYC